MHAIWARFGLWCGILVAATGVVATAWASSSCTCNLQVKAGVWQCNGGSCGAGTACHVGGTWQQGTAGTAYCACAPVPPPTAPAYCHTLVNLNAQGQIVSTVCMPAGNPCGMPQGTIEDCVQTVSPCNSDWTECKCR